MIHSLKAPALAALVVAAALPCATRASGAAVLTVGDEAPEFSLPGSDGKTHSLKNYRGERAVVIAWFPKAFTSG